MFAKKVNRSSVLDAISHLRPKILTSSDVSEHSLLNCQKRKSVLISLFVFFGIVFGTVAIKLACQYTPVGVYAYFLFQIALHFTPVTSTVHSGLITYTSLFCWTALIGEMKYLFDAINTCKAFPLAIHREKNLHKMIQNCTS